MACSWPTRPRALRDAGLHRITVSLDTLHRRRFETLTRFDEHAAVLAGIDAAARAGFDSLKLDSVIMRGVNDDELVDLIEYGRSVGAEVRFIEYMDVGGATRWNRGAVVSQDEMLAALEAHYGRIIPLGGRGSAPADRFALPDGTTFGIIASTTRPFCADCDRSRLTADGVWLMCLYARAGTDLRRPAPRGGDARRPRPAHSHGLVAARGSRRRGTAGGRRTPGTDSARGAEEGRAPGDAHEGWIDSGLGARDWGW